MGFYLPGPRGWTPPDGPPYPRAVRVLAVDFGEKRIGLAVSDLAGEVVLPGGAVFRRSDGQAAAEVAAAAREREVERIVVGLPVRADGAGESPFAVRARSFARKLAEATGLPVELHGEALTSVSAEGSLREAGLSGRRRAAALDAEAAAALRRDWLGSRPAGDEG